MTLESLGGLEKMMAGFDRIMQKPAERGWDDSGSTPVDRH